MTGADVVRYVAVSWSRANRESGGRSTGDLGKQHSHALSFAHDVAALVAANHPTVAGCVSIE
jgi:hypothetical protein